MVWTLGEGLRRRADRRHRSRTADAMAGPPSIGGRGTTPKDLWGGSRAEAVRAANSYHHKRSRPALRVHTSDRGASDPLLAPDGRWLYVAVGAYLEPLARGGIVMVAVERPDASV